jgi:hypothetical protein
MEQLNAAVCGIERRMSRRWRVAACVFLCWTSEDDTFQNAQGVTRDISAEGVYLDADGCPPVGMPVQMDIMLSSLGVEGAEVHLTGEGVVLRVWLRECGGSGSFPCSFAASMRFSSEWDEALLSHYFTEELRRRRKGCLREDTWC